MATTNVTINRTSYTEVAAIGTTGRITNLNEDDIYVFFKPTAPADTDIGHLCVGISTDNNIFELNGNATDKAWVRLANNSLSSSGTVSVTVGEAGAGGGGGDATAANQVIQSDLLTSIDAKQQSSQIYMLYDSIANIPTSAAANTVVAWNTFFSTDAITAVATSGNAVTLTCSHQFSTPNNLFKTNSSLLKFIDNGAINLVGYDSFASVFGLTDFVADGVVAAQWGLLSGCTALVNASIGNNKLVTLDATAFYGCTALKNLAVNTPILPDGFMQNSTAYNETFSSDAVGAVGNVLQACGAYTFTLPNLKQAGNSFAASLANLQYIYLPNLETTGAYAFQDIATGSEIHIPNLKSVGFGSFTSNTGRTYTVYTNSYFANTSSEFAVFRAANTVTVILTDAPASQTTTSGDLTSTATTSTAQSCDGANTVQLTIKLGTATTPPSIQIQGSDDGTNWYSLGLPLAGVASSTVTMSVTDVIPKQIRWKVSSAGATIGAGWSIILRAN